MIAPLIAVLLSQVPAGMPSITDANLPATSTFASFLWSLDHSCMSVNRPGGTNTTWTCLAKAADIPTVPPIPGSPQILLAPAATAPGTSTVGDTYFDTAKGCLQTWSGYSWLPASCAAPTIPSPPNTLLSPAATAPATSITGATFYDTAQGCLRTWNGSTFPDCGTATGLSVPNYSSSPSLPGADAAKNKGRIWFDTTQGCFRSTIDGLSWGTCLTVEKCQSFAASGLSIPALGVSTSTVNVTLTGARVNAPCAVTSAAGFPPVGASAVCYVSGPNTLQARWNSSTGLLSGLVAIPNGTYYACTSVYWGLP